MSSDGRINKSPVPVVITLLILILVTCMYTVFPVVAVDLVGLTLFPAEWYAVVILLIGVLLALEVLVLRRNLLAGLIDRFERYYMKKLEEEYSRGDDDDVPDIHTLLHRE